MSIRKQLTLWYALILVLIIVVFSLFTFTVMRMTMIRQIDNTLNETEAAIRQETRISRPSNSQAVADILLPELDVFRAAGVYVQAWVAHHDQPLFSLADASPNIAGFSTPLAPRALGQGTLQLDSLTFHDAELRVLTRPLIDPSGEVVGYLQVGGDLSMVNSAVDNVLLIMAVASGFAIFGSIILSMWFSHRALLPITHITRAAASIANTDDLSTRLVWAGSQDELGKLTSVFNQMMTRIEHLFSVQRRFVADVSHELRTPLTTILGNVELIQRYGSDTESLEAIDYEAHRMSRMVNDLLLLARADYGGASFDMHPVDLDTVLMEAVGDARKSLLDRGLSLKVRHFHPVRMTGNADWLKQLLLNLISNAIKFTPEGGEVRLGLEQIEGRAVLWVQDTGCGIPAADQAHIFQRFFRTDPARTHDEGGFGLGLAIAHWIVMAHRGEIRVQSKPGEGSTFIVYLPVDDTYAAPTVAPGEHSSRLASLIPREWLPGQSGHASPPEIIDHPERSHSSER